MLNKKPFNLFLLLYCWILAPSCTPLHNDASLQEGDLLFQNLNCGELCDAIEAVTEGVNGKEFSHCALVVNISDTLKVVEAIGQKVQINSLKTFFARSGDTAIIQNISIARVNKKFQPFLKTAIRFATQQVGQPYDNAYTLDNGKWYCSELLYQSFKEAWNQKDFFELEPMTFKDPIKKTYFPAWIDYFKQLNLEIPEGKQGINPGLISRSDKIYMLSIHNAFKPEP